MSKKPEIPSELFSLVDEIGAPVTNDDIDAYGKWQEIRDKSLLIKSIVDAWSKQQRQDRAMRKKYAWWLMFAMAIQAVLINATYILIGFGILTFDPWTSRTFIMTVFGEIAAMVFVIVKYLFRPSDGSVLKLAGPLRRTKNGH